MLIEILSLPVEIFSFNEESQTILTREPHGAIIHIIEAYSKEVPFTSIVTIEGIHFESKIKIVRKRSIRKRPLPYKIHWISQQLYEEEFNLSNLPCVYLEIKLTRQI